MRPQESFASYTGRGGKESLDDPTSRRNIIANFLREEAAREEVAQTGIDVAKLDTLLTAAGRGRALEDRKRSRFLLKLEADKHYVPLARLPDVNKEASLGETLREFEELLPALKSQLNVLAERYGATLFDDDLSMLELPREGVFVEGGFHAGLSSQGHRLFDDLQLLLVSSGTDESPKFRALDLARAYLHDSIHILQARRYSTLSVSEEPKRILEKRESDMKFHHLGGVMFRFEGDGDGPSLGAALLEYVTDMMAREGLLEAAGLWPEAHTPLERLRLRDLGGDLSDLSECDGIGVDESVNNMRIYQDQVIEPAERVIEAFGLFGPEVLAAIRELSFVGTYGSMQALRKRLDAANWTDSAGRQIDKERIKGFAQSALVLRPLFPGSTFSANKAV
jgi:hypothetical protein